MGSEHYFLGLPNPDGEDRKVQGNATTTLLNQVYPNLPTTD